MNQKDGYIIATMEELRDVLESDLGEAVVASSPEEAARRFATRRGWKKKGNEASLFQPTDLVILDTHSKEVFFAPER